MTQGRERSLLSSPFDLRTRPTSVSPEYARMLGYDPEDFNENDHAWIERLDPDDREGAIPRY